LNCPSLKELCLWGCANLRDCSVLLQFPSLEKLMIRCCENFVDYSVLKRMKHLKQLAIENEDTAYEDLKALQASLPDCSVNGDSI